MIPLIPSVYSLPSWNSGVAFGPSPCSAVALYVLYGAA